MSQRIHIGDMVTSFEHSMVDRFFKVIGAIRMHNKGLWDDLEGMWQLLDFCTGEKVECVGCFITVWGPVSRPLERKKNNG